MKPEKNKKNSRTLKTSTELPPQPKWKHPQKKEAFFFFVFNLRAACKSQAVSGTTLINLMLPVDLRLWASTKRQSGVSQRVDAFSRRWTNTSSVG